MDLLKDFSHVLILERRPGVLEACLGKRCLQPNVLYLFLTTVPRVRWWFVTEYPSDVLTRRQEL